MALFYRRLPRCEYAAPHTLDEALELLAAQGEKVKLLAGGTDLIPQLKKRKTSVPACLLDLKRITGLDGVSFGHESGLSIGALATIRTIAESPGPKEHFPALVQAARSMASPQVRNRGTFVGNICNAVPSADSAPPLLALGARVLIRGSKGARTVPLEEFFTGPSKTVLEPDEVVTEIAVPDPAPGTRQVYLKLGARHSMDLAIVGVGIAGRCEDGVCKDVRIGLGAVAPTPVRAPVAEEMLRGQRVTADLIEEAARHAVTQCSPIDDHRASQEYRCEMIYVLTKRALTQILL